MPRVQARLEAKALFSAAVLAAGSSLAATARAIDVDESRLGRKVSPKHPDQIPTLADVVASPEAVRHQVARQLLALDATAPGLSLDQHLRRGTRELGQFGTALEEALADDELDEDENDRLDKELADIEAWAAAARRDLRGRRAR